MIDIVIPTMMAPKEEVELLPLIFSDAAADKVKELLEANPEMHGLRVFVQGGGCSGYSYGFSFVEELEEDDLFVENDGVKLFTDLASYQYLAGATLKFVSDLNGEQFSFENPNAESTCGCGTSFCPM